MSDDPTEPQEVHEVLNTLAEQWAHKTYTDVLNLRAACQGLADPDDDEMGAWAIAMLEACDYFLTQLESINGGMPDSPTDFVARKIMENL